MKKPINVPPYTPPKWIGINVRTKEQVKRLYPTPYVFKMIEQIKKMKWEN